ncbi:MAG: ABC transporter ATP-binding protein [Gallionellales bacterium GWA2_60_142]|nr:MAG: ABC transporter ATP-binding protein [Gallionellales bacterium GWA2_60_142]HCI14071.1 ABC transporter ATP-binding protein [Gallionellaceae bacterium]
MIQLSGITKIFSGSSGNFTALDNITLQFDKGSFVAVVGKSGSGKSTLLNMLTGIDRPDKGTVVINGIQVHKLGESRLATWRGANIGIVFQFFQLIPTLTIRENLLLAMDFVAAISKQERLNRANALLELVGIAMHADKFPSALSGGEQQRAAIARALANDPPILVADEPTGNLDSRNASAIHALFRQLVEAGKTVIVVTHEEVSSAGYDRVVTLRDGRLAGDERKAA